MTTPSRSTALRVGFATSRAQAELTADDRLALVPLARLGIDVVPVVWDDPTIDWAELDAGRDAALERARTLATSRD